MLRARGRVSSTLAAEGQRAYGNLGVRIHRPVVVGLIEELEGQRQVMRIDEVGPA